MPELDFKIGDKVYYSTRKVFGTVVIHDVPAYQGRIEIAGLDNQIYWVKSDNLTHVTEEEFEAAKVIDA